MLTTYPILTPLPLGVVLARAEARLARLQRALDHSLDHLARVWCGPCERRFRMLRERRNRALHTVGFYRAMVEGPL